MNKTDETKAERFVRLAEPRVTRACKAVSLLGNLAASGYEYTDQQVKTMFDAVHCESAMRRVDQVRECPHTRIRGFISPLYTADTSAETRTAPPKAAGLGNHKVRQSPTL